jgi:hypothetical protein
VSNKESLRLMGLQWTERCFFLDRPESRCSDASSTTSMEYPRAEELLPQASRLRGVARTHEDRRLIYDSKIIGTAGCIQGALTLHLDSYFSISSAVLGRYGSTVRSLLWWRRLLIIPLCSPRMICHSQPHASETRCTHPCKTRCGIRCVID